MQMCVYIYTSIVQIVRRNQNNPKMSLYQATPKNARFNVFFWPGVYCFPLFFFRPQNAQNTFQIQTNFNSFCTLICTSKSSDFSKALHPLIKAFIDLALASIGRKSSVVAGQRPLALWRAVGAALDIYIYIYIYISKAAPTARHSAKGADLFIN